MATDIVPDPGVLARIDLDPSTPRPTDCLVPGEEPIVTASLSPGWIAITEREFLAYHPEKEPPVERTDRANVSGLVVRRTGGGTFLGYVPGAMLYALAASVFGVLLLALSPETLISIPNAPESGQLETIVRTLGWAMDLLGTMLVFTGILAALLTVAVVAYWLRSRDVAIVIERGGADPIECPTTSATGTRAIRELESNLPG